MKVKGNEPFVRLSLAAAMLALAGCAGLQPPAGGGAATGQVSANPPPRVQDCGIVGIGSPTKYACNGKVYTSFELAKLRLDWEKNHGG